MQTTLDEANSWFLESLGYCDDSDDVCATVVEGTRAKEPSNVEIAGKVLTGSYVVAPTAISRRAIVRFSCVAAWQVIAEVLTVPDESDVGDISGSLRVLTKSKYLDFLLANHGWFESLGHTSPFHHYQLITESQVLDVVAAKVPTVENVAGI